MCYVWLNQAFFYLILIGIKDQDIIEQIKNGTVAYELCRPYDLYWWWYFKHLSKRYAGCLLRCYAVIIVALLLPAPYNLTLPASPLALILFIVTLFFGSLLITAICMIINTIAFFTYNEKGITSIIATVGSLLSGIEIPLPLMPTLLLTITEFLPFRLISDLSHRLYSGNLSITYGLQSILLQIIWIIIIILIGKILMKKALSKVSIQGG